MKLLKKYWKEVILAFVLSLMVSSFISNKMFFIGYVPSVSMDPTLMEKDRIFVTKNYDEIKIGDIYTFNKDGLLMVKRCIAGPEDTISIKGSKVIVNGIELEEDYVSSTPIKEIDIELTVPLDNYIFLGDNRGNSNDARYWDNPFVEYKDITGKVEYIVSPFRRIKDL